MKIAGAYIRVSTLDQIEYSPESQINELKKYAQRNDLILPTEFIFIDEGISGKSAEKRPAFMQMIGTAKTKPKPFDTILVWKFSRFARNREDAILYKSMLRKDLGIDVVSISENVGDDKMSVLIEAMIEAMDEYYSINLAEEVKRGMTERVKRGEVVSAPAFGYDVIDKKLVINEEKSSIVRLIFDKFIHEENLSQITNFLNNTGIKTARGNKFQHRNLRYILTNPVYCGKIRWSTDGTNNYYNSTYSDEKVIYADGTHESIISKEDFEKVQEKLAVYLKKYESTNAKRKANLVASKNGDFMLRGMLKCSSCGSTMSRSCGGLNCVGYAHRTCTESHYISFHLINYLVIDFLEKDLTTLNFEIIKKTESIEKASNQDIIKNQIKKLEQVLIRHKDAYANGIDTIEEYKQNKENVTNQIGNLQSQLVIDDNKIDKVAFAKNHLKDVKSLKDDKISQKDKNELLRSFVDHIVFNRKTTKIQVFYYL